MISGGISGGLCAINSTALMAGTQGGVNGKVGILETKDDDERGLACECKFQCEGGGAREPSIPVREIGRAHV